MIDILILLGGERTWDDNELRYALRSIEKNLTGYRDIYIAGIPRKWLQNVKWIEPPIAEAAGKQRRIFDKIIQACLHPDVSETFVMWNDDHFLLKPLNVLSIKYWKQGDLKLLTVKSQGTYQRVAANSMNYLKKCNLRMDNFDVHVPILYEKEKFLELLKCDWERDLVIKSLYCNYWWIKGEDYQDLNIGVPLTRDQVRKAIEGRTFFSINENGTNGAVKDILQELYPMKSKYET